MARRSTELDPVLPVHIGARAINREWFELPMECTWEIMSRQLNFVVHAFGLRVFSFVLMSNHFHLMALAPEGNLSQAMCYFMRESSRELGRFSQRINMTYGGRFFRSQLASPHYFLNCYKYVYRNPVQAGLVTRVEDYRWSTLRGLLGFEHQYIPLIEDQTLFDDVEGTLAWLNSAPDESDWEAVRKALRRREFKLAKDRNSRCAHHLERDLL